MSKRSLRAAAVPLAGVALSAVSAAPAAAAVATKVADQRAIDATSDGRYVLLIDGSVLDRTTGATVLAPKTDPNTTPLAIADRAPITLERTPGGLVVRSAERPDGEFVSVGPDGIGVPAGAAELVQNGTAVIFGTTESGRPRILRRDLTSDTTTVLLDTRASLLDASEDGKVVTWQRVARIVTPDRTSPAIPQLRGSDGYVVGYAVAGESPRAVATTKLTERRTGDPRPVCPDFTTVDRTDPIGLQISQDGAAGGRYALTLQTQSINGNYPFSAIAYQQIGAGDAVALGAADSQTSQVYVFADPVSGAYVRRFDSKGSSGGANSGAVGRPGGPLVGLDIPSSVPGIETGVGTLVSGVPTRAGAGAVFSTAPRDTGLISAYAYDGPAIDPAIVDATPWTALPRSGDQSAQDAQLETSFLPACQAGPPVAAPAAAYAQIVLGGSPNQFASVFISGTPAGNTIPATSVKATVSWYGLTTWSSSRTLKTPTATGLIRVPDVPAGVPGFKLTVVVTLENGAKLTQSVPMRRAR